MNLAYPFKTIPGEERFHLFNNIKVKLHGADDATVFIEPLQGNVLVTNLRICWFNFPRKFEDLDPITKQTVETISAKHGQKKDQWHCLNLCGKSFMFEYNRLLSHGIQGNQFRFFLGPKDEEEEITYGEEQNRALQDLIAQNNCEEIVQFESGKFEIELDLSQLSNQIKGEIFDVVTEYSV